MKCGLCFVLALIKSKKNKCDFDTIYRLKLLLLHLQGSQAFLEYSDFKVLELAKEELQPLLDSGILKMPKTRKLYMKDRVLNPMLWKEQEFSLLIEQTVHNLDHWLIIFVFNFAMEQISKIKAFSSG